jgi:hypothetical protein
MERAVVSISHEYRQEPMLWGCREHRTPPGVECLHCADQGELFPRCNPTQIKVPR